MTVRRLRANQRGPKCSYCEERANKQGCGFRWFACASPDHTAKLAAEDNRQEQSGAYETEGERQAMGGFWR